jgi:ribosome-associated toxin RatA of RatAB toxin-antitoxin module
MAQYVATRTIAAPVDRVFATVAHIDRFQEAVPHITNVEFLTETRSGVGTRFRETRLMRGREASTELEVTEYVQDERVRLVSDAGGTVWDTVFTVQASGSGTELSMVMDARPYKLTARVVNPMISRMLTKVLETDMDAVKAYCEGE